MFDKYGSRVLVRPVKWVKGRLICTVVGVLSERLRVMPAGAPRLLAGCRVEPYVLLGRR